MPTDCTSLRSSGAHWRPGSARRMLGPQGKPVRAAHHVRQAVLALDELIGVVDMEQVLDRVFSRFCVGK